MTAFERRGGGKTSRSMGFKGFTLAEVLITLGISGVVAALTLPAFFSNYQKHVVENRLKNFYSMINQALRSYVAANGELDGVTSCGNKNCSYSQNVDWLNTHILPFIKYRDLKKCRTGPLIAEGACVYLYNGDSFAWAMNSSGGELIYCIKCDANIDVTPYSPKKRFAFEFDKNGQSKNYIEPYAWNWNGTIEGLKNDNNVDGAKKYGCRKNNTRFEYCTKYIQVNGWKIPDDYPW